MSKASSPKNAKLPLEKLWNLLEEIPKGHVSTYKAVAQKLKLKNPRNVGWMLKQNVNAPRIPCHRVIQSSGFIGGYSGASSGPNVSKKLKLLKEEGIHFTQKGKIEDPSQVLHKL